MPRPASARHSAGRFGSTRAADVKKSSPPAVSRATSRFGRRRERASMMVSAMPRPRNVSHASVSSRVPAAVVAGEGVVVAAESGASKARIMREVNRIHRRSRTNFPQPCRQPGVKGTLASRRATRTAWCLRFAPASAACRSSPRWQQPWRPRLRVWRARQRGTGRSARPTVHHCRSSEC